MSGTVEAVAYTSLSPSMCPCTWLTWASPQHGDLRVARLLTRKLRSPRALVPRGPGRNYKDPYDLALEIPEGQPRSSA